MKRARSNRPDDCPFVGKGGLKLRFALEYFGIDPDGLVVADLGCNVGGFTDCLLQRGASRVYAVDTSYGLLAWKLRNDPRVVVCERTNVLHWVPPEQVDLAVSDLGWTKQQLSLPAIGRILTPVGSALSLLKPQYEAPKEWLSRGVLPEERVREVVEMVLSQCPSGLQVADIVQSPYRGSGGNIETWMLVRPDPP
jgi:23S rRNA (cytidine1920-2'-O)/16S rRNA (cytidine1409-2'-O)-methyltransferase